MTRRGRHSLAESVCGSGPLVSSPDLTMCETSAAMCRDPRVLGHISGSALRVSLTYPMMRPSMSSLY